MSTRFKGKRKKTSNKKVKVRKNRKPSNVSVTTAKLVYMPKGFNHLAFPPRYCTRLHGAYFGYLPSGQSTWNYSLAMNNLYLPYDISTKLPNPSTNLVTYHIPGFNTFCSAALYRNYVVMRSKLQMTFYMLNGSDPAIVICLTPTTTNTFPSSTQNAGIQRGTKKLVIDSAGASTNSNNTKSLTNTITTTMYMPSFVGVSKEMMRDDYTGAWCGTPTTNPSDVLWTTLNGSAINATNLGGGIGYTVDQWWEVEFFNLTEAGFDAE